MPELNLNFNPFPELTTERLLLRKMKESDAEEIFLLRSNEEAMKYIDRPRATSLQDGLDLIRRDIDSITASNGISWAITRTNEAKLIGTLGFWRMTKEHFRAEIGYMLHPLYHGKGIMHEAIGAAIHFGFHVMNLHSIEADVNPDNIASIKLLEKNNFIREALYRENYFYDGKFLDSAIYSLLTPLR